MPIAPTASTSATGRSFSAPSMTDHVMPTVLFGSTATLTTVPDAATARLVADHLRASLTEHVSAVVPGAETVLTHAAAGVSAALLLACVESALTDLPDGGASEPRVVRIPVRYDGADLSEVASLLSVSTQEVVARHCAVDYEVAFLGFAPGFPYLTGLDPFLAGVPRLDVPRTRVPAGSVGLAAGQTCIYPSVSPGGWRLLGSTSAVLFDAENQGSPALLAPGDRVRFEPTHTTP